jgi:hypothetical protein
MTYTIIEDCSPYYIRFTHDGIDNVVAKCLKHIDGRKFTQDFTHSKYALQQAQDIISSVPMNKELTFDIQRVSLFVSNPGLYYRAHKDGMDHRFSLNYTVKILDNKCVTSWYSDEDLNIYNIDHLATKTSRECEGFDKTKHVPLKSMTAVQGEGILFNTEIFHDFDNTQSDCQRMVLTLRIKNPGSLYFEDVRKVLFGY